MIASVSAADSSNDVVNATDGDVENVNAVNNDSLRTMDNGEILGDGETDGGTYDDLVNKINNHSGNNVDLWNNYIFDENSVVITIDTPNLIIDGHGFTINAKGNCEIFYVSTNHITIKNIKFINGYGQYAGAIDTDSPDYLTVENCTFIDNYGGSAGAIYPYYGNNVNIVDCTFIKNHGTSGAIMWGYYSGNIKNCIFINNSGSSAGSIYWSTYSGDGNISNCIFVNNSGINDVYWNDRYGSQVYADYNWWGQTTVDYLTNYPNVSSNLILNNYYVLDLNLDEENRLISISLNNLYENNVLDKYDLYDLPSIDVNVKGTFVNVNENVALGETGMATVGYEPVDGYSVTISYQTVELTKEIKASLSYLNSFIQDSTSVEIHLAKDCEFDPYRDSNLTEGIVLDRSYTIDGQGHYIDAKGQCRIFNLNDDSKTLTLKNIIFKNAVGNNGAAVYANAKNVEVINCTFEGNQAENNGAALYIIGTSQDNTINQCIFINNECNSAIFVDSGNTEVTNSILVNNSGLNIKGNNNVVANYNWFGHNASNYDDDNVAKVEGVSLDNCLFLNLALTSNVATISLNNLHSGVYDDYALPKIKLYVKVDNVTADDNVIIGETGVAEVGYDLSYFTGSITVGYDESSCYTTELEYVITDNSFTTLQKIIGFIPENGNLNLEQDYVYNPSTDSALVSGITFTRPITINGNNHKIDANEMARISYVNQDIIFNDVTFVNANSANAGYYNRGAVVYNDGGNLIFFNCSFINNAAETGGGVYNSQNNINQFEKCTFINNKVTSNGGVISLNYGLANFTDCIFENNSANFGGVFYSEYYGQFMFDNCTFLNNSAKMGAAIKGGNMGSTYNEYIKNSKFISNRVINGNSYSSSHSIIFAYTPVVEGCSFINNTGSYAIISTTTNNKNLIIKNSIFLNNTANYIFNGNSPSKIVANYNWFGHNSSNYEDGSLVNVASGVVLDSWLYLNERLYVSNADISLNNLYNKTSKSKSTYTSYSHPEIILNVNSTTLQLDDDTVTLASNGVGSISYTMDSDSGALTVSYEQVSLTKEFVVGDFDILQDLINKTQSNLIELDRDYTYMIEVDSITEGIEINKNIIIDGKGHTIDAKGKSGIFLVSASNVTFRNVNFVNGNSGYQMGSAIYYYGDGPVNFNIENCTFKNNIALRNYYGSFLEGGGAIYLKAGYGNYTIKDSIFINNTAPNCSGGAIYSYLQLSQETIINISNCSFINNSANIGGAILFFNRNTVTTIDYCKFINNSANDAGAVHLNDYSTDNNVVNNSIFLNNGEFVFANQFGSFNLDNNWWGNNVTNFDKLQDFSIQAVTMPTRWLFLNSSITDDEIYLTNTSTIVFFLQSFDNSTNEVSDYDKTKLPEFNLTLISQKGTLDKNVVLLDEAVEYTSTGVGRENIVAKYENAKLSLPIVNKGKSSITVNINPVHLYVNSQYLEVSLSLSQIAELSHEGKLKYSLPEDTIAKLLTTLIKPVSVGNTTLTIYYDDPNGFYDSASVEVPVIVSKLPLVINVTYLETGEVLPNEIVLFALQTLDLAINLSVEDTPLSSASADWSQFKKIFDDDEIASCSLSITGTKIGASANGTATIEAKLPGVTNLTLYYNQGYSDRFDLKNVTIKITVLYIPTQINLNHADTLEIKVDDSSKINATLINATGDLTYESSDENIIQIINKNTGVFKAVGNGTAIITVKYAGDEYHNQSTKDVTVLVTKYDTTTIFSNHDTIELKVDEESQITATLTAGDGADLGSPTYVSSNESVATVGSNGLITAVGEGTAIITAKYDGNYKYTNSSDSVNVTVSKIASSITLNTQNPFEINVFDEAQIDAILNHEGSLSYVSSNPNIVEVNQTTGNITAKAGGRANITISYAGNNKYGEAEDVNLTVVVSKLPSHITVDNALSVDVDANINIIATVDNGRSLRYVSNNLGIVTVDESTGVITGVIGGTANVTVIFDEDDQYLSDEVNVTVTVNKLQSTFTIENPTVTVDVYGNALIQASSNNGGDITFTSCDISIVTVDGNKVTALKGGKVNITLSVAETDKYLSNATNITVMVNKLQSSIVVADAITVSVDESKSLDATVDKNRQLRFLSTNPNIVTVNSDGEITGVIGGTANVTVIFDEDDQYLGSKVNVTITVSKLEATINVGPISVDVYQNKSLNAQIISDGVISYISTNPGIVTVNEAGYVTGIIGGKANVTVSVTESNRYLSKTINVTVTVNKLPSIFTNGPMSLSVDENATINSTLNHDGKVRYEFDPTKLNVTEDGLVIALSGGVHTILVIFDGNEWYSENSSTVTVTVSRLPADYEDEPINLTVFETSNIEFLITGYDHTNSQYSSSNETVFTVDSTGLITAQAGGSAILNIKFPETDKYLGDSINITVNVKKLPSILTGDDQISVKVDETKDLAISVNHNRQLIYESSNPNIVAVDDNGLIRGIIGGTAFITVRYDEDGQYLANSTKVAVTVNKLPSYINVETQPITIYVDDGAAVIATTDNDGGLFFTTDSSIISLSGEGKVTGLSEGTANVIIAVFETETHLSNRTTLKVTVKKIPTAINVEELQMTVDVDDSILINASLNHTGAGPLTYTSSNPEVISVDGDGRICALIGGEANITISYAGDDKFIAAQDVIVNVVSNRLPTVIEVNDTFSLKVDDSVLIGAFPSHDGMQLRYLVGNSSVVTIDGATGEITAIAEGVTDITISCEGTEKYLKAENVTVSVEVSRIQTAIIIISENPVEMNVFDESTIIASLNYTQAGKLAYASSDENVVTVDEDGIITAIGGGKANITVSYEGNYKYAPAENVTVIVVVNKLASSIIVDDELSVDVDSSKSINAYMEIDCPLRYVSNDESIAIVDEYGFVTGLVGGKTNITVIFDGDSQYERCEADVTVTVNKLASRIDVENQQLVMEVGGSAQINATTDSDAHLTYVSLDPAIASVNGIVVTGIIGGTVNVTVSVPESDRYLASEVNVTVVVKKHDSVINIESDSLIVNVDGTVNIVATTNSDAGLTYVSLDPAIAGVDGNAVKGIASGVVNVTISVGETDKYLAKDVNVTVTVKKIQSVIDVESDDLTVDVDGNVLINASTNSDAGLSYLSLDSAIVSVEGNVVTGVAGGTVNVTVSVAENRKYLANEVNVTVTVNKLHSVINIESDSLAVDVDGNVLINASTNSDAGLTYVSLDPAVAAVEGNVVTGISSGIVNVTLSVSETDKYLAKDVNVTVTVNKVKSVISANNITVYVDETKSIDASLNVDGSLRYINNNPEIVSIDESGVVKGLIGGTAKITIIFDETESYLGSEVNVTVTVNKLHSVIDLESDSLTVEVGGNVLINASTNSDAGLIYESLDESIATVNLNNVTALIGGKAIVSVSVPESDRYLKNSVNVTVVVKKHDSIISIENDEITIEVDGKEQIIASTNSDSPIILYTTSPIITIGGTGMVTGVSNGTAKVTVYVAESDKYSANTSVVIVKVNKVPTSIAVNESISVTVDDETNINATLNHEGQLSFISLNESIASVDAQGNIKAVKVGKTQIIVSFKENEKYIGNSVIVDVTVNKIDIPINDTISMDLKDASRTPTFSIDLPNATGNFSVIVDGKEIGPVSLKDGKAKITVPELAYGSHNVTVVYSGDEKYDSIAQNTTVNITKPVLSENKDIAMLYTANVKYIVRVTVDGKPIVGQYVTFKFDGKTKKVKTDNKGYASYKLPTAKPKKAKYLITATFNDITVKNKVTVNSIIKAKNLNVKKSNKVAKIKVSLKKVNGKYLKGKKLKLKIKGKTLKAKTNKKGKAVFKVKKNVLNKLKVGKKYKYKVIYGKDVVTKKIKVKR